MMMRGWVGLLLVSLLLTGCTGDDDDEAQEEVVVYCALDRGFSQPVLEAFTEETGIEVRAVYDTEATKTTGLVNRLREEQGNPRCDVFWNNELVQTIGLARDGALEPYDSPSAEGLPDWARDPEHRWTGFAARARVLIVNTDRVEEEHMPTSTADMVSWKRGKVGIAKPLNGTTATHVAALFAVDRGEQWLTGLKANEKLEVCAGNADVMRRVSKGELDFGLTDTDDLNLALLDGAPVKAVFPDQEEGGLGTLLIPNSVAIIKNCRNPDAARKLVDYLLRPEVAARLAKSRSVQIPLRPGTERAKWIPTRIRTMKVTWDEVADQFDPARKYVQSDFLED